ncbi:hypothetical protein C8R43DRAFT_944273 [Mycena crocata]|nr:hypothetical protein C8R43DRAFT_944273 [Mycena crocata]
MNGRLIRWDEYMSRFDFEVTHIEGAQNKVADCLSRYYENDSEDDVYLPHEYVDADVRLDPGLEYMTRLREAELRQEDPIILARRIKNLVEDRIIEAQELHDNAEEMANNGRDMSSVSLEEALAAKPPNEVLLAGDTQFITDLAAAYIKDPFYAKIVANPAAFPQFQKQDDLYYIKNREGVNRANPETSTYTLELSADLVKHGNHPTFHASLLRSHEPNDTTIFPNREANRFYDFGMPDDQEWYIDEIVAHQWTSNRSLKFHVKWTAGDYSWETPRQLEDVEALDDYLMAHGIVGGNDNIIPWEGSNTFLSTMLASVEAWVLSVHSFLYPGTMSPPRKWKDSDYWIESRTHNNKFYYRHRHIGYFDGSPSNPTWVPPQSTPLNLPPPPFTEGAPLGPPNDGSEDSPPPSIAVSSSGPSQQRASQEDMFQSELGITILYGWVFSHRPTATISVNIPGVLTGRIFGIPTANKGIDYVTNALSSLRMHANKTDASDTNRRGRYPTYALECTVRRQTWPAPSPLMVTPNTHILRRPPVVISPNCYLCPTPTMFKSSVNDGAVLSIDRLGLETRSALFAPPTATSLGPGTAVNFELWLLAGCTYAREYHAWILRSYSGDPTTWRSEGESYILRHQDHILRGLRDHAEWLREEQSRLPTVPETPSTPAQAPAMIVDQPTPSQSTNDIDQEPVEIQGQNFLGTSPASPEATGPVELDDEPTVETTSIRTSTRLLLGDAIRFYANHPASSWPVGMRNTRGVIPTSDNDTPYAGDVLAHNTIMSLAPNRREVPLQHGEFVRITNELFSIPGYYYRLAQVGGYVGDNEAMGQYPFDAEHMAHAQVAVWYITHGIMIDPSVELSTLGSFARSARNVSENRSNLESMVFTSGFPQNNHDILRVSAKTVSAWEGLNLGDVREAYRQANLGMETLPDDGTQDQEHEDSNEEENYRSSDDTNMEDVASDAMLIENARPLVLDEADRDPNNDLLDFD